MSSAKIVSDFWGMEFEISYKLGPKMSILRDPYVYIRYLRENYLMPEAYTMQALNKLRTYKSTCTGCSEKIAERAFSIVYLKVLIIHIFYRILWWTVFSQSSPAKSS